MKLTIACTVLLFSNIIMANNYKEEALNIKNSINPPSITNENSIRSVVTDYKGKNSDESNYYSQNSRMKIDAQRESEKSEITPIVKGVNENKQNFTIDRDEDWIKNSTNLESGKSDYNLSFIASKYDDCSNNDPICYFIPKNEQQNCTASRKIKFDKYHKYQCSKEKYNYQISCNEKLDISCKNSSYSLPHTTYMSFPNYYFTNNKLGYITPNRMHQNCSGYNYYWRFHLNSLNNMEELRFIWGRADDRTLIYINNHLVHNYPHYGCERGRTFHSSPNKNLKPYLRIGNNEIRVRIIVGGRGEARGEFKVKYKKCNSYRVNRFNEICDNKKFTDDRCVQTSKICTDANSNKHIGQGVYQLHPCWNYKIKKSCQISNYENFCNNLDNDQSCSQLDSKCVDNLDNSCRKFENKYKCSDLKNNRINNKSQYLGYFEDLIEDYIDYSNCKNLSEDKNCILEREYCQDRGSQNIDGIIVERDCWQYNLEYSCKSFDINNSNCSSLENDANCSLINQSCKNLGQANCQEFQRQYRCNKRGTNSNIAKDDILFCGNEVYCDDNLCDEIDYQKDQNFTKAASNLSILNEAGKELTSSLLRTFTGKVGKCEKDLINYQDCCSQNGWGDKVMSGSSCTYNENNLAEQKDQKLCTYIGNFCSKEYKTGLKDICVKKKQSYCCFGSKIARIIHEQGRSQLGISWGNPKNPNCNGITIDDLQRIDFNNIDFSELAGDMAKKINNNIDFDAMKESIINNISSHYE